MEILNNNTNTRYLYHISDIHIRRYDRHVEYDTVFNNLYSFLKSSPVGLIVLTGDLLHNKDNLTPDCVVKTFNFLRELTKIMPVILIAGNHDFVQTNVHIKDSISAILSERGLDNLYYLKYSGIYQYGNIVFGVSSLFDDKFTSPLKMDFPEGCIKIGLYHGPVGQSETSVGFILNGDKTIKDFDGYDYVLLGDIHKFQHVGKNIAYASSLISQNFSETDKFHGVLVWDMVEGTNKYNIIENPYRHMEVSIINNITTIEGEIIDLNNYIFPENARIKLCIKDTLKSDYDIIKKRIRKRYNNVVFHDTFEKDIINPTVEQAQINYIELLNKFIEKLSDSEKIECITLFSAQLNESELAADKLFFQWELLDIEFSNMFVYGEKNKLDFTKLPQHELIGLFAPNSSGKSSLIDTILFSLYDNFSRNISSRNRGIPSYIINNKKTWFETKIRFKLGDAIYTVHKKGRIIGKIKSKTGKAITFDIHSFTKLIGTEETNLTRKDRFETQKEIDNVIGTYDDFCLTTLFLQNKELNFFDMKTQDRKEFLYNLLYLDKFEKMHNIFRNEEKIYKIKKDDLIEKIQSKDIDSILEQLVFHKKTVNKLKNKIKKYSEMKQKYTLKRQHYIRKLNNELLVSNKDIINKNYTIDDIAKLEIFIELLLFASSHLF